MQIWSLSTLLKYGKATPKFLLPMMCLTCIFSMVSLPVDAEQNSDQDQQPSFWERMYLNQVKLNQNLTEQNIWLVHQYFSYLNSHPNNSSSNDSNNECSSNPSSNPVPSDLFPSTLPTVAYVLFGLVQNFTYVVSSIYYTHHVLVDILFSKVNQLRGKLRPEHQPEHKNNHF